MGDAVLYLTRFRAEKAFGPGQSTCPHDPSSERPWFWPILGDGGM